MLSLVKKKACKLILPATEWKASQALIPDLPQARQQQAPPPSREQQDDHLSLTDLEVPSLSAPWPGLQTCINIESDTRGDLAYTLKKEKKKMKTLHPVKELLECEYCDMKFSVNTML